MTPTRNTGGLAHENGLHRRTARSSQARDRRRAADAGTSDFDDLAAYRRFIDEIVGRRNARKAKRIDIERAKLEEPDRRTSDYEQATFRVTCSERLHARKVFHTRSPRA